jgi:hypothetical protein
MLDFKVQEIFEQTVLKMEALPLSAKVFLPLSENAYGAPPRAAPPVLHLLLHGGHSPYGVGHLPLLSCWQHLLKAPVGVVQVVAAA